MIGPVIELASITFLIWNLTFSIEWALHVISHIAPRHFPCFVRPWVAYIHAGHMSHHIEHYPVSNLRRPGAMRGREGLTAFGPPIVVLWGAFYCVLPLYYWRVLFAESFAFIFASNYLHSHFHKEGSWLENTRCVWLRNWFNQRRARHFYHHRHLRKNMTLGGLDYSFDRLGGTFVDVAHLVVTDPACVAQVTAVPPRKEA